MPQNSFTAALDSMREGLKKHSTAAGTATALDYITEGLEHYCTGATQLVMSRLYPYIFNHKGKLRVHGPPGKRHA
ncbi:hypothetical protein [Marispirochaeta sp.]|uniref:hypothetical protein n=1 Tax=Marispirochaeta sp. TaxID=2038653 RepID=UPI0029C7EFF1|nr:hypothetical protein [Marispirochaeta sp.]